MLLAESSALFSCSRYTFPHVCVCGWPLKKNRLARYIYGSKRGEIPTQKYNNIYKEVDQSFFPSICIADQRSNFWLA
jgi:hypothetical protein